VLATVARIRWAAIALSFAMVRLTTDPSPVLPQVLAGLTFLMVLYNVPLMFSRRAGPTALRRLAIVSLLGDFAVCTGWVALTANDANASNYIVYMVIATEAAVLFNWRGTAAFVTAFLATFALIYVERTAVFGIPIHVGSLGFRFGIVTVMALLSGSLSSASETRRASAEAAAKDALAMSDRLETVHRVARGIASSLRRDDVLLATIDALRTVFPERWSGIMLEEDGVMHLALSTGEPKSLEHPLPPDPSLYSITEALVVDDLWSSAHLDGLGVVVPDSLRAYHAVAIVPLHAGERLLGALVALDANRGAFTAPDVGILETIGQQISMALENALLYEQMERLSLADSLTYLGNRRAFDQRLEQEIERVRRHGGELSLALVDIDHFKLYNDTHGHQAGDEILRLLGSAFSDGVLRRTDVAFRYGGEEFAVVMASTSATEAEAVMRRVHLALRDQPLPHGEHQPGGHLTISVGIGSCDQKVTSAASLLEQADLALLGAKQSGRNRTLVYDSELAATLTNWTHLLPGVIRDRAVHSIYQPIVRLQDGAVVAYEALVRPDSRDGAAGVEGMFTAAQRMGYLQDLDWLSFRAAIQDAAHLGPGHDLFVNITVGALLDASRDPEYIELVLRWARRPTTDVVFEISEREAVNDLPRLTGILDEYRALGFRFALDDVGEGHSTLELLAAAEPEFVKIARTLVRDVGRTGSVGTVRALVEYARATGATVVAEGIEDAECAARMLDLGVELGQGFGLGRPAAIPVPDAASLDAASGGSLA